MVKTKNITVDTTKISANIILVIAVIITQVVMLFVGKYLWNKYLVDSVTCVKPLKSVINLIAIIVLVKIIFV
jgi:hypothetical protein